MLVSDRYRWIFIHIQKTAGSSFRQALLRGDPDAWELGGKHAGVREVPGLPEGYRVFAMVRNPWERLVSWYEMILEKGRKRPVEEIRSRFYRMVLKRARSFDDFLYRCTDDVVEKGMTKSIMRNQVDYLIDESGRIRADVIGRFEQLAEDTKLILEEFGVGRLPHIKQSREYGDWRRYYNPETRKLVADRFRRDIELLGYRFQ